MNRHAWLQKHPSPRAAGGEFHWYPEVPAASDRELRAGFVERVRGVEPPAVLWQLERGRVAWGQVFSATTPLDGRRYVGLVLSVVEGDRPVSELLALLAPPPPVPWTAATVTESSGRDPAIQELIRGARVTRGEVAGVVRALLSGGAANVDDPASAELPAWIASIERVLPEPSTRPRCGVWCIGSVSGARGSRDRVAELAAAAWREPASRSSLAWTLLCELAIARGESVDRTGGALEALDAGAVLTAAERAQLAGAGGAGGPGVAVGASVAGGVGVAVGASVAGNVGVAGGAGVAVGAGVAGGAGGVLDVLHAWGRGQLDRSPAAATLAVRLADLVALRVLARLAAGDDASDAIAEARWYALLPAARREALLAAVAQRTTSLRALVEAHHA
jgi:hypothetical protein